MISDAKSLRISDIHIDVRAWEGKACNIVIRSFCGQRRFSVAQYISKGWYHYLQFIQNDLHGVQGSNLQGAINGRQINTYKFDHDALWKGYWDFSSDYTNYLLNNVYLSTFCN